jgi:hypothetical protein
MDTARPLPAGQACGGQVSPALQETTDIVRSRIADSGGIRTRLAPRPDLDFTLPPGL